MFAVGEFKKAVDVLQRAATLAPESSTIQHWLGKSHGRLAETSSFLTAPSHASNCRKAFEKAVALDPKNILAMNDLFEYYLEAPGFLGGGLDKAEALTSPIGALEPAEQHYALARLAEKRRDPKGAEQQLRRAVQAAPQQAGRLIDLAKFLARQGRHQESDRTFQQAERVAPGSPALLFERANTLIETKRSLPEAKRMLEQYLHAPLTPDDPPRGEARKLLNQMSGV
jgi:cytochrome c-type biogenesis protein CcmH/NrfG